MKGLNRYVIRKHASDWYDIGLELGVNPVILNTIDGDHTYRNEDCFRKSLDKWLSLKPDATWKILEVALTNVNRAKLGLDPVDDVYGKDA